VSRLIKNGNFGKIQA